MSWAEVKKINGNMNMPLDELFKQSFALIATDTPISENIYGDNGDEVSIKVNYSGTIALKVTKTNKSNAFRDLEILKNGSSYFSIGNVQITGDNSVFYPVYVSAGDVISTSHWDDESYTGTAHFCGSIAIGGKAAEETEG